ncbi:MAG: D-2-hydroxyacid dehydrogenase [Bacteroidales bacterium]|nr:D-2-hydroxyacid dehydrogenase [Bacteroidales bacterium]MCF8391084.1 D-2-hydroxyacid dehydrogenase [Bacteroidales bacterium]
MINIVFLDAKTVGEVQNFRILEKQGKLDIYETTSKDEIIERSKNKDVIITNKVILDKSILQALPNLKLICISATGMNNVDLDYAREKGISVKNVVGYSTESVAQLTFTLLLHLVNRPYYFDNYVKSGAYSRSGMFTHLGFPFWELSGKRLGIIGLGKIGRRVAQIGEAFGMDVAFYSTSGMNNNVNYRRFDLDTLLSTSDIISIHAPLNNQTKDLINLDRMKKMKPCAILLNTGRGGIIVEKDLARALNENIIGAAGIDVMEHEPINGDNPLLRLMDKDKLVITPHIAWASIESRQKLIAGLAKNISEFSKTLVK